MKSIVMISAVLLALVGFFASATSPNPSDHLAGKLLIAVAVGLCPAGLACAAQGDRVDFLRIGRASCRGLQPPNVILEGSGPRGQAVTARPNSKSPGQR